MKANRDLLIFIIGILILLCLHSSKEKQELKEINCDLTASNNKIDSLYIYQSERLLNYTLITIKQNEIIDQFNSSRKAKLQDAELMELQNKLN
tara:strand:+ start:1195 stop:1473 length:279 start_codon:yes stop_codon:yes gene_type:complete